PPQAAANCGIAKRFRFTRHVESSMMREIGTRPRGFRTRTVWSCCGRSPYGGAASSAARASPATAAVDDGSELTATPALSCAIRHHRISLALWLLQSIPTAAPQLESIEPDRRPLRIRAGVDNAIDHTDGVQPDFHRILRGKLHLSR